MKTAAIALAVMVGGWTWACDGSAWADATGDKAREHYRRGEAQYKVSEYAEALKEFKAAYLLKQDPALLFNIAQCHRLLAKYDDALLFYRRFLKEGSASPRNRAEVQRLISEMEAKVQAGSTTQGATPPPAPAPVAPVPPSSAHPTSSEAAPAPVPTAAVPLPTMTVPSPAAVAVPAGATERSGVSNSGEPPSGSAPVPRDAVYRRWWFWTLVGGVAAATAGAALLLSRDGEDPSCLGLPTCVKVGK